MFIKRLGVIFAVFAALTFLSGCGINTLFKQGATNEVYAPAEEDVTWNPQQYSGLTHVKVEYDENGQPKYVSWWDGKEKTDVSVDVVKNPDGTVTLHYTAKGVAAFEGQGLRANVETGVVEVGKDVIETGGDVIKAVTEIVTKSFVPVP